MTETTFAADGAGKSTTVDPTIGMPLGLSLLYDSMWGSDSGATPFGACVVVARGVLALGAWTLGLAVLVRSRHRVATG